MLLLKKAAAELLLLSGMDEWPRAPVLGQTESSRRKCIVYHVAQQFSHPFHFLCSLFFTAARAAQMHQTQLLHESFLQGTAF